MPTVSPQLLRRFMNLWPPLLFAGIRVKVSDVNFRHFEVELKLRWWNRNMMGTQFGGSLFAMTDPFYMLMLSENLGPDYVVWDKAADIDFVAPGRGKVHAKFLVTPERLAEIRAATADGAKYLPVFEVDITDVSGTLIAKVKRVLYVRKKKGR